MILHRRLNPLVYAAFAVAPLFVTANAVSAPNGAPKSEAEAGDDNARVRSLFRRGSAAFEAGKLEESRQLFLDSWAIRQTYDVASSLAQVEMQLKRYRDAAEHLAFCIRNFAPVESEQTLDQVKKAFADVKTRVASVRLSADRKGAEIVVDGLEVGTEPLPAVVFVEPGVRRLAARLDGDTAEQSLNAQAGKEYVAELKLSTHETKAAVPAAVAPPPIGEAPPQPVAKPNYAPAIVTASVGGAALITSVVLLLEASHKDSQWHARLDQLPGANQCAAQNPNSGACDKIQSLANDARTFRALSFVGFGAAAAAGAATFFLWPRTPAQPQLGVRAMVLPSHAGLDVFTGLDGTF
jgi:hypothetical protein